MSQLTGSKFVLRLNHLLNKNGKPRESLIVDEHGIGFPENVKSFRWN